MLRHTHRWRSIGPGRAGQANLLVLDEPTNHLDLPAVEQLEKARAGYEQALAGYDGTMLLVTHDRRLLEGIRPTHVIKLGRDRTP